MKKRLLFGLLFLILMGTEITAYAACDNGLREVYFSDKPKRIYVGDIWTEVVFPEPIIGRLKQNPEGLDDNKITPFSDRLYFKTSEKTYHGIVFVHGKSGRTYTLKLLARINCPDTIVKAINDLDDVTPDNKEASTKKERRKLMEFMMLGTSNGKPPEGVRIERPKGTKKARLVFRQGSVSFYIEEVWHGRTTVGTILLAENYGRTPYHVAIQSINFSSPALKRAFGRVKEISMVPYDGRLSPAPEFAIDHRSSKHQGLIYIVSKRQRYRR